MSNRLLNIGILVTWLCLHLILAYQLYPFAYLLFNLDRVSTLTALSNFVDLNTMTRFLANMIDKYSILYSLVNAIKALEFFAFILDLALVFALIENKRIVLYAKFQLVLAFLFQALIYALFIFSIGQTNTHFALTLFHSMGIIIYLWMIVRIAIPVLAFIKFL